MKGVELYGRVRYAVQIEGLSHREAARRHCHVGERTMQSGCVRMSSGGRLPAGTTSSHSTSRITVGL